MTEKIEYETITIEVPKQVMELLRFSESMGKMTPKEWIEYSVVETVRSGLDANMFLPSPAALAEKFNLNPVFKEILNDTVTTIE